MQNIEPMTMGSPPAHLSSPGGGHGTQHGSGFLPSYLMGEPLQSSPSCRGSWLGGTSPPRSSVGQGQQRRSIATNLGSHTLNSSFANRVDPLLGAVHTAKDRPGAPPSVGLMESFTANSPTNHLPDQDVSQLNSSVLSQSVGLRGGPVDVSQFNASILNQSVGSRGGALSGGRAADASVMFNASQREPVSPRRLEASGMAQVLGEPCEEAWVTVFGFPPAATSYILEEFSYYGNIVKQVIAPNGNWVHIRYQSKLQVRKALSKNGKVFSGNIMIGVVPYTEKENSLDIASPQTISLMGPSTSGLGVTSHSRTALGRSASMRPLTQRNSTTATAKKPEPDLSEDVLPEKNNSYIKKAMEFVFGL